MSLEGTDWAAECPRAPVGRLDERGALSRSCDEKYERKCEKKSHRDAGSASLDEAVYKCLLHILQDPSVAMI